MFSEPTMPALITPILWLAITTGVALCGFLIWSLLNPALGFWPASSGAGWQHKVSFSLFRGFCGALVVYGLLFIWQTDGGVLANWLIGLPIMGVAYGVTLWGYRSLGVANTYCNADGLVTGGLYTFSRNPQYVSSVMATVGLAITAGSWVVLALAGLLFAIYLLFALNEERWLKAGYGQDFLDYMQTTPRFLDLRSLRRAQDAFLQRR